MAAGSKMKETLSKWAERLVQEKQKDLELKERSILVFRLGKYWFGLDVNRIEGVAKASKVHTIPHFSSKFVRGLASARGEIHICVSLKNLLEIKDFEEDTCTRMVVIEKDKNRWAFLAEEVTGTCDYDSKELKKIKEPRTIYLKEMLKWNDLQIEIIDEDLLFYHLMHLRGGREQ